MSWVPVTCPPSLLDIETPSLVVGRAAGTPLTPVTHVRAGATQGVTPAVPSRPIEVIRRRRDRALPAHDLVDEALSPAGGGSGPVAEAARLIEPVPSGAAWVPEGGAVRVLRLCSVF